MRWENAFPDTNIGAGMSMGGHDLEPDAQTQAEMIHERLREHSELGLEENIAPEDFVESIDPDKPVPVNFKRIAEEFAG